MLFVPADAVPIDQRDEVARRVARQRRAAERRVVGQEVRRPRVAVGEVAAAAAGDADLLGDLRRVVEQQDPQAALPGDGRAQQAGGAGADDDGVESLHPSARVRQKPYLAESICRVLAGASIIVVVDADDAPAVNAAIAPARPST